MEQIKVGDIVRVSEDAPKVYTYGWWTTFKHNDCKVLAVEDGNAIIESGLFEETIPTKYLVKVNAEPKEKPNVGTIPVEPDLTDGFWRVYEAELAKEIAVKLAGNVNFNDAKEKAAYAVECAREVVENLKKSEK